MVDAMERREQNGNMRAAADEFGLSARDIVDIPFIWIPDGYRGPRPGYPWFEAGRLALSSERLEEAPPYNMTAWQGGDALQRAMATAGRSAVSEDRQRNETSAIETPPGQPMSGVHPASGAPNPAAAHVDHWNEAINSALTALHGMAQQVGDAT